jgi:hypothetical protein
MRFPLVGALALARALIGVAMRASTSEPLAFRRSAMRATSPSERMGGRRRDYGARGYYHLAK